MLREPLLDAGAARIEPLRVRSRGRLERLQRPGKRRATRPLVGGPGRDPLRDAEHAPLAHRLEAGRVHGKVQRVLLAGHVDESALFLEALEQSRGGSACSPDPMGSLPALSTAPRNRSG